MRQNTLFFIIGFVLAVILLSKCKEPKQGVSIKYIPGDSIPYVVYKDKPRPYKVVYRDTIPQWDTIYEEGLPEYVIEPVDTAKILREFYATATYQDTVKDDSSALIVLTQDVSKNRIARQEVWFQNRRATQIVQLRKNAIVLGVGANYNGIDLSVGVRMDKDVVNLTYSNQGVGIRYQRELGWK